MFVECGRGGATNSKCKCFVFTGEQNTIYPKSYVSFRATEARMPLILVLL